MPDVTLSISDAEGLIARALMASATAPDNACSVARALVAAEVDGQAGHGFSRVAAYAAQARSGKVDGFAVPAITRDKPSFLNIDASDGFAFPAIDAAIDGLHDAALETGLAAAAIRRSHHCGQIGAHVERLADRGLIGLMVANSPKAMAPWGGADALFGTNPIAFAAPRRDAPPLVIDLSLSRVARGRVMAASKRGDPIPEGWALGPDGRPTTDAQAALAGTMIPMGEAKGAALALMVEVLAATVTGANYSYQATSFFEAEGAPPGVGQFMLALPVTSGFAPRLEELLTAIASPSSTRESGTRLPGTRRLAARTVAQRDGVVMASHLHTEIKALTA